MNSSNWLKRCSCLAMGVLMAGTAVLATGCQATPGSGSMKKPTDLTVPSYTKGNVDGYEYDIHADGGMIYDPISREAEKTGALNYYDGKPTETLTLKGSGYEATFTMPTALTPYTAVPINYTIKKTGSVSFPLSIVATAFEESGRSNNEKDTYDLSVPGNVAIDIDYLGYVTGTVNEKDRHYMMPDNTDDPADLYPHYSLTNLTKSGTVQSGDVVWLKFKYTNTGNTILDCEGTGGFVIEPILQRRNPDGSYTDIGGLFNQYIRELTYVYPGETREFWLNYELTSQEKTSPQGAGLTAGNYRVNFKTYYRTEYEYEPATTMWAGYPMQTSTFDFTVSDNATKTTPEAVKLVSSPSANSKNKASWLHYFEEFMTTYEQYRRDPGKNTITGTIYVQPASFTEQIVIKVITGSGKTKMVRGAFPVTMQDADVSITYNPDNINTVVKDDGLAWPAVQAQTMNDMRVNISKGPAVAEELTSHILDMQDCGITLITNQGWSYLYDITMSGEQVNIFVNEDGLQRRSNIRGDALKYTMDVIRRLGIAFDGMGGFYFGSAKQGAIAKWINPEGSYNYSMVGAGATEADRLDPNVASSAAVMLKYQRERWGDTYWTDRYGVTEYFFEDTGGYTRYEGGVGEGVGMVGRGGIGKESKKAFIAWLTEKYGTVEAMNNAWGTKYASIEDVDPEKGLTNQNVLGFMHLYYYDNKATGFDDWEPAVIDLDIFRTESRLKGYSDMLTALREDDPKAMVQIRTEGSNMIVPCLDTSTSNPHYRNIIYNALRNGTIPELVAMSDAVRSYSDYVVLPLTPSEVSETVKLSVDNGLIPMLLPQFNNMRDFAMNEKYGRNFQEYYNLESAQKGAFVKSLTALFPWWKATYEAGGVPGILWEDYACDGVVTETQQKEMKYFNEKIAAMMADPEVQKQAKATKVDNGIEGKYAYKPEFVDSIIEKVKSTRK